MGNNMDWEFIEVVKQMNQKKVNGQKEKIKMDMRKKLENKYII